MQKPRTKTKTRCHASSITNGTTHRLQRRFMIVVHLNIGQQSKIIAFGQTITMRLEISVQRTFARSFIKSCGVSLVSEQLDAIALENRSLRRQRSVFFIFAGQLARREFAGFNVRLIEWIDADDRTGDSGGDFPTKKFLAET